jgi:hypothetical protein
MRDERWKRAASLRRALRKAHSRLAAKEGCFGWGWIGRDSAGGGLKNDKGRL